MTAVGDAGLPGRLAVAALIVFAAVTPLLPTHDLKADATLISAVIVVAAAYVRTRAGGKFDHTAVDRAALAFLLVAILATIFSVDPFVSLIPSRRAGEGLLVYVGYVALLLAAARLNRHQMDVVLGAVLLSGAVIGAVGTAQYFGVDVVGWLGFRAVTQLRFYGLDAGGGPALYNFGRSNSTLGNPIFLGGYATLLLPVTAALVAQSLGWRPWAYGIAGVMLFGALIGSQTRAAWIAAGAGVVVAVLLSPKSPQAWRRLAVLALACAVLGGVMLAARQEAGLPQRAASTVDLSDPGIRYRLYLWKHTLPMIAKRPLLGWGFSTMLGRFQDLGSEEYFRLFGFTVIGIDTPHNDLLHIAYSIGLLGLAAYLWIWVVFARSLRVSLGAAPRHNPRLDGALLASLLAYFLWVQSAWPQVGTAHIFWTFGGIAVAMGREARGQGRAFSTTLGGIRRNAACP